MDRRNFIRTANALSAASISGLNYFDYSAPVERSCQENLKSNKLSPLAITMWEFSWLERRWPGAGYEDWDRTLTELVERGYDAVRIDAFPHLIANGEKKVRKLIPHWDNQSWGSPFYTEVQVQPNLNHFIKKCKAHNVKVGLSTWWREDSENLAADIKSGKELGSVWKKTLDSISEEDLLDNIIYVDLSNEYSINAWTPYLPKSTSRNSDLGMQYMYESIDLLKESYPDVPFCFSITSEFEKWETEDISKQDLLELHIWIASSSEFNDEVGYHFQRFGNDDYKNLQLNGLSVYRKKEKYWLEKLNERIQLSVKWSKKSKLPIITTECWGPIDYKDMPLLDWQWVKDACEYGTMQAAQTGRWLAIATSNFCGPQFVGMWQDIQWHQRLTKLIHEAPIATDLLESKLGKRIMSMQSDH